MAFTSIVSFQMTEYFGYPFFKSPQKTKDPNTVFYFFVFIFSIGIQLIYKAVLASGVQHTHSFVYGLFVHCLLYILGLSCDNRLYGS